MPGDEEEIALPGGNMGPVHRRGDRVLRPAGPWTPAVHRLLAHCRRRGLVQVPAPFGLAADGRETVSFLPGAVPGYPLPDPVWSETALRTSAELLRRFHDASADADRTGPWRSADHEPVEVICHNDAAPYNMVFDGEAVTGLIDFDYASPGSRLWDLAYLAYRIVPVTADRADGFSDAERTARLTRLLGYYGTDHTVAEVHATIVDRLVDLAAFSDARAVELGNPELAAHAVGYRRDARRLADLTPGRG